MKTIKILKNQKPTELDVSLKYSCPNCKLDHWLFLREAKTKNYRVVCDCGTVFKPQRIDKLVIKYHKSLPIKSTDELSVDTLNECVRILGKYGFEHKQSITMLKKAYIESHSTDISTLIKIAIKLFGESNNV